MATDSLVFIVGAGASKEVDLPTGKELTTKIAQSLDFASGGGNHAVHQAIALHQMSDRFYGRMSTLISACERIVTGMPHAESIDSFIHENRSDPAIEFCGKLAACVCILEAESQSALAPRSEGHRPGTFSDPNKVANSWYRPFFDLIKRNRQHNELSDRLAAVKLIVFNYDRCIEHFLVNKFCDYYHIDLATAEALVRQIQIVRPYGSVGSLLAGGPAFGQQLILSPLIEAAQKIRTFTQGTTSDDLHEVHRLIVEAEKLVFLGFAFHPQNITLLTPSLEDRQSLGPTAPRKRVFATAKSAHQYLQQTFKERIKALYNVKASGTVLMGTDQVMEDVSCSQLFERYASGFSFE